ncbi:transposase family protein [Micromonospora sp. WMMD1102]|uniref:transposase family protein n=1 Tax=Micromonospora sp. WMMD1102 TaxID=3016105 RepID=UPI0024152FEA|nr:transposase family protein [Micromonospora sp. WMMD1102]MDG4790657.1 transposase family protein [Micromonospora sp. WMMD1102]
MRAPSGGIWTSEVRPGREHDTTAVRTHPEIPPALAEAGAGLRTLGDLGYEGLAGTVTVAFKRSKNGGLLLTQQQFNRAHHSLRAIGERGNLLLKMTFKALRNVSLNPWRIGKIVAAALVILHIEHDRTTRPSVVSSLLGQPQWADTGQKRWRRCAINGSWPILTLGV